VGGLPFGERWFEIGGVLVGVDDIGVRWDVCLL
jgi:hypothetical protein